MLELNQIYCGDCLELMKELDDGCVDLTVTSPPYDNLRTYKGYNFDFEPIVRELFRVTKQGGVVVWVVGDATIKGNETGTSFKQALYFKEIGFNLHDTMIYASEKTPLTHKRYEQGFEYMFVFSKGSPITFNPKTKKNKYQGQNCLRNGNWASGKDNSAMRQRKGNLLIKENGIINNIWHYKTGGGHTTKDKNAFDHPAVFPEQLAADHITTWTNPNDIVLDPMNGSGTSTKVAKKLNRRFIGFDISEEYCKIAEERLKQEILPL